MTHVYSLVVGCFQKYGLLRDINTIWWKLYIIIFECVFINEGIWQRGRKRGRAELFKREQRVCDAFWGRIRDHTFPLTVCCSRTTRCIRVLKNFIKPYIFLKQGHSNARVALTRHWNRMWNTIFPIRCTERRPRPGRFFTMVVCMGNTYPYEI